MKILLVGEYSRLHNSLKEGLQTLGHEVLLLSIGDSFKDYPADIKIQASSQKNIFLNFLRKRVYQLIKKDISQQEIFYRLKKIIPLLRDFDIVQFINQDPFNLPPKKATEINNLLINQNKNAFLLACGEDSHIVDYYKKESMDYSILTPLLTNPELEKYFSYSLKYLTKEYKENYDSLKEQVKGIIATDFDYVIPYSKSDKSAFFIPNPVNVDKIKFQSLEIKDKIGVFHGINRANYYKKGSHIIVKVLKELQNKYPNRITVIQSENIPYHNYVSLYQKAPVFIDQLFSYDQGYNALEAMAAGKCVLTGFEKECKTYYQLKNKVAINAAIDPENLFKQIEALILAPENIIEIGKNAREFIEKNHHYISIAKEYVEFWRKKGNL